MWCIRFLFLALPFLVLPVCAEDLCITAREAMLTAKKIRGLAPKQKVPCEAHNETKIKKFVVQAVKTETPEVRIRGEGVLYKALGIVPKNFDYENELVNLYTSQIGGYYDPKKNYYVMASWMPASMQYPVSVHELVHALQDQYFDLEKFMDIKTMSSDELMARSALVEGDATAVMVDYTLQVASGGTIFDQKDMSLFIAQNIVGAQLLGAASPATRSLLTLIIFPYSSGLRFAHTLIQQKRSYSFLNEVFKSPPRSTEEILHPEKYGLEKKDFEIPVFSEEEGTAYHQDTLGEFFLSVWLNSQGVLGAAAANAAAGWGGDRAAVYEADNNSYRVRWDIRFDSEMDVQEFQNALQGKTLENGAFTCQERVCRGDFILK